MSQAHSLLITAGLFGIGIWLIARGDTPHGLLLIVAALPNAQQVFGLLTAPKAAAPPAAPPPRTGELP